MPFRSCLAMGLVLALLTAACSSAEGTADPASQASPTPSPTQPEASTTMPTTSLSPPATLPPNDGKLRNKAGYEFPDPPQVPEGELDSEVAATLETLWASLETGIDPAVVSLLGQSDDARLAWLIADLLRFIQRGEINEALVVAFIEITATDLSADPVAERSPWQSASDHLFAWDLPAPPDYRDFKGRLFTIVEPGWQPFFEDAAATIDWRLVSWGGVGIDDRGLGDQLPCTLSCIPALDDPSVTDAAGGSWYEDDRIVFGVVVNGEARAYPKHQMETHEMVNDTLGGRRIGLPYCTLCGSAQVYFTDSVPAGVDIPVLRTSGLLSRSNKVMYDLNSQSVFDTFTGEAVTGPFREAGIVLEQGSVITSTWGEWKAAHPTTTIVAQDGGIGRIYRLDPLGGRDDAGPIFPVGDVDPRLPIQAQVVGVIAPDGTPLAFPVDDLVTTDDGPIQLGGVTIEPNAGGFEAFAEDGTAVAAHQSFWFAWSQFHPDTLVWSARTIGS